MPPVPVDVPLTRPSLSQCATPPNDFLGVCTAWQLRPVAGRDIANDRSNIRYDADVIGRLRDIDRATRPTMTRLTNASDRYESYQCRFIP